MHRFYSVEHLQTLKHKILSVAMATVVPRTPPPQKKKKTNQLILLGKHIFTIW